MLKRSLKFLWRTALVLSLLILIGLFAPKFAMQIFAVPRTFSVEEVRSTRVAIVFGAGLLRDGSAGPVLSDRVQTAVQLYEQGKVEKLLMSGDNRFVEYNEPEAMRQYALQRGVPNEDIVLDYAGRRTYDTCYRAKHIFGVEQAILVTQAFHMPRALFLCSWFGLESTGVEADNRYFLKRSRAYWNFRELFAAFQAVWDVLVTKPLPVLGEPEPIFE
ncbi:MAG: ElyC/SanA/YdcF family protein [Anaerolineales bacterium]|nr:MAG: ElyC/SanA/YdcF family protein [Anaerolineales bacterium]